MLELASIPSLYTLLLSVTFLRIEYSTRLDVMPAQTSNGLALFKRFCVSVVSSSRHKDFPIH